MEKKMRLDFLLHQVCDEFGQSIKDVLSASQKEELNKVRRVFVHLARKVHNYSFRFIAESMNRNNHTTALNHYRTELNPSEMAVFKKLK